VISEGDFCPGSMLWVVLGKNPFPTFGSPTANFMDRPDFQRISKDNLVERNRWVYSIYSNLWTASRTL